MTPGLALFYGGMVRAKRVLNMMMMSFGALALVGVLWVLFGYSLAFGDDVGAGLLGSPGQFFGLSALFSTSGAAHGFTGAIADRARFGPWLLFTGIDSVVHAETAYDLESLGSGSHLTARVRADPPAGDLPSARPTPR